MKLTAKQEKFAQELAKGKSQYQAYITAYPNQADNTRETVDANASKLANSTKIVTRVDKLREPLRKKFQKTLEDLLNEMEELKTEADDRKLKLDCMKEQGKLLGFYTQKVENTIKGDTLTEILDSLENDRPQN
jgi:hypothetical protein